MVLLTTYLLFKLAQEAIASSKTNPPQNFSDPALLKQYVHTVVSAGSAEDIDEETRSTRSSSENTVVDEPASLRLKERHSALPSGPFDTPQLVDGQTAVAFAAYALSELAFFYPLLPEGYLGEESEYWAKKGLENARGNTPKVVKMETRPGSLNAVLGAANSTASPISVLTSSAAIPSMIPNMHAIANSKKPVVFHVKSASLDSQLTSVANQSDVLAARHTGFAFLASGTVQEAHDFAIIAHLAALRSGLPILHHFDDNIARNLSQIQIVSYDQLKELESLSERQPGLSFYRAQQVIQDAMNIFARVTGRQYKTYEYTGSQEAETVIIAHGALANIAKTAIAKNKYGVVNIRVYRPWSEDEFLAALPAAVKRVLILEEGEIATAPGTLFLDVAASILLGRGFAHSRPTLVNAPTPAHFDIRVAHIKLALKEAETERLIDFRSEIFANLPSEKQEDAPAPRKAVFWDIENSPTATVAKRSVSVVSSAGHNVNSVVSRDAYQPIGSVVNTQVAFSKAAHVVGLDGLADYIAVHDISLLKTYDVLATARDGATLVVNSSIESLEKLPEIAKVHLAKKLGLQVYLIDAGKLAGDLGLDGSSVHGILLGLFLKLNDLESDASLQAAISSEYDNEEKVEALIRSIVEKTLSNVQRFEIPLEWKDIAIAEDAAALLTISHHSAVSDKDYAIHSKKISDEESSVVPAKLYSWHQSAWHLIFREAYGTEYSLHPESREKKFLISVSENRRLTPLDYDRNVFHMEFDTTGTGLRYEIGDALGVYGHNDPEQVLAFLQWYGVDPLQTVVMPAPEGVMSQESRTLLQLFTQHLDLFGRPSKRFYESLAGYSTDEKERAKLLHLVSSEGAAEYKSRVEDTVTYADLLREFTSARPPVSDLVALIAPIKPRHYSIASSQRMHPNSVHLLVVAVDWQTKSGEVRQGQCTRYLANLRVGDQVTVSIKPSVMRLPPLDSQPVLMAGLGTGMAPFRAFLQEREMARREGRKVGPMILYFGSRHRSMEYLYGEELEVYSEDGLLTRLGLAFSRDQAQKIYIQHRMKEDSALLYRHLVEENGHFYLCGPTWPVPDVKEAIVQSMVECGGKTAAQASAFIEELKEKERYVLEVY
ncbi:uncharacterized protein VTP21DRAFT_10646 [Calcarisporiella thermophila]|uniref:uncharacterized protein n=1 Tax=Calcarisporiella thermophila TaxID=911321 RepID=UPI0037430AB0